jgi:hypothetical protein
MNATISVVHGSIGWAVFTGKTLFYHSHKAGEEARLDCIAVAEMVQAKRDRTYSGPVTTKKAIEAWRSK